jgi:hypothetical protein
MCAGSQLFGLWLECETLAALGDPLITDHTCSWYERKRLFVLTGPLGEGSGIEGQELSYSSLQRAKRPDEDATECVEAFDFAGAPRTRMMIFGADSPDLKESDGVVPLG